MQPGILSGTGPGQDSPRSTSRGTHLQQLQVLVVEDHPAHQVLLVCLLQKLGLGCEVFGNGQAALAAMALRHFDLVLSDGQMPVMDGYAMARAIRCRERAAQAGRIPIIALTAGSLGPDEIQRCIDAGMDAWRVKPLTLEQLREVLASWLPGPETVPRDASHRSMIPWPTRASLIETFGCTQVVEHMLLILIREVQADLAALAQARINQDATATAQHLHRLVGSVAFLGDEQLEARGRQLSTALVREGVTANVQPLVLLLQDLFRYLAHLKAL